MENKRIQICIGRQFGAGGRIISKMLTERFGCQYFDKEILKVAAEESGFSPSFFKENDEKKSFFHTLFHDHAPMLSDSSFYSNDFSDESLFKFQCDAIRKEAKKGNCLFIGRCADYVLRDDPDMVSVFITANIEDRVKLVRERLQVDEETARKIINKKESSRASYYNFYTGKKWGYADSYNLCLNSSFFGMEGTAELIAEFIEKRFQSR